MGGNVDNILIIEDEKELADILGAYLKMEGCCRNNKADKLYLIL